MPSIASPGGSGGPRAREAASGSGYVAQSSVPRTDAETSGERGGDVIARRARAVRVCLRASARCSARAWVRARAPRGLRDEGQGPARGGIRSGERGRPGKGGRKGREGDEGGQGGGGGEGGDEGASPPLRAPPHTHTHPKPPHPPTHSTPTQPHCSDDLRSASLPELPRRKSPPSPTGKTPPGRPGAARGRARRRPPRWASPAAGRPPPRTGTTPMAAAAPRPNPRAPPRFRSRPRPSHHRSPPPPPPPPPPPHRAARPSGRCWPAAIGNSVYMAAVAGVSGEAPPPRYQELEGGLVGFEELV